VNARTARPATAATPPKAIIFDLDGTLVDTVEHRIAAWLAAFDEAGIATSRDAVSGLIGSDGKWLARRVAGDAGRELDDEETEAIDKRSGEIYEELNVNPRPLPGARDVLTALDEAGIQWAIGTSSRRAQVRASVDALHLDREPMIIDGSHVAHAKPAPDLLLLAARELDTDPASVWCVGDSTFDMRAAVAAGMPGIGVTTGSAAADALREAGAAEVLSSLDELARQVRSWVAGSSSRE
jgi:HAD superfamily hydrolase (TIGR01509 family)